MSGAKGKPSSLPRIADIAARVRAGENLRAIAAELDVPYRLLSERFRIAGYTATGEPQREAQRHELKTHLASVLRSYAEPWMAEAICSQTDPDAFYPEKGCSSAEAKRVCQGCPVREICLEFALANHERWGIYGGKSERERRKIEQQRKAAA